MAYKKIRKDQTEFLKGKQAEQEANDKLIKQYNEIRDLGGELLPHQEKRLKNLEREKALRTETVSLEKKLNKQSQNLNRKKANAAKMGSLQIQNLKKSLKQGKINTAQFKSQVAVVEQIASGQASAAEIQEAINDLGEDATDEMKKYLKQAQRAAAAQEMGKEAMSEMDSALGGMGGKVMGFLTNPLTAAVALLVAFNEQQQAIGDEFGALGVMKFRDDLAGASQEFTRMGLEGKEALTTAKQLSSEFGIGFAEATAMATSVGDIAKSTGMSTGEATKLMGTLTTIGGLSEEAAVQMSKQAESLAVANGVAPGVILKDIAENSETFAKFSSGGAKGLARAAIQARKLGVEFSDIANAAEGMLDFQNSLNAEVNASVMLGRQVNLQKARELALTGDLEGFQSEILKQIGGQAAFDKMNVLQKKALADATGMSVEQLGKMVSKEKEAVTLSGQLAKQKIDKMVPEETITATAELMANMQAMGMQMAEQLGPTLEVVVGLFGGLLSAMESTVGVGPALIGMYATMIAYKKKDALVTIYNAVAKFFGAAADMSVKTMGFGTAIAVAMAVGAVATMMGMLGSLAIGDMHSPADGKTRVSTKEGGLFELSKNDDLLAAPGLASAVAGAGGGGAPNVSVNTAGIERGNAEVKGEMAGLRAEMKEYFGFGGSAAKAIGSKVGDKMNSSI